MSARDPLKWLNLRQIVVRVVVLEGANVRLRGGNVQEENVRCTAFHPGHIPPDIPPLVQIPHGHSLPIFHGVGQSPLSKFEIIKIISRSMEYVWLCFTANVA